jgi:hypothetical protein
MILSLGFFRLSMAGPACHLYSQLGYRQHECSSIFVLPVARLRIRSGTHSVAIIFRHLPFRLFLFLQELQSAMSTWKHGILGCCDSGCGYFCVSMYCCAPCTWGKVWSAYDFPGGYVVGCCCGGGMCCQFMVRNKVAQEQGIDDGICAFVMPFCFAPCSMWQVVQEAKDAGKLDGNYDKV